MKERSKKMYERYNFSLYVASIEDIFLFKAITTRPDDLADMASLAGKEIQWNIVEEETRSQDESWKWIGRLHGRLEELEDEYGIPSPLKRFRHQRSSPLSASFLSLQQDAQAAYR